MQRAPHLWNTAFAWRDHDGPFSTITTSQARDFDKLGYFVFEHAFDTTTLAQLTRELAPGDDGVRQFLAGAPDGRFSVAGLDTQTVAPHAVTRSAFVRRFVANEV